MTTELFANTIGSSAASTTLAANGGSITSGATSLKVASATGFSITGGQMRGVIEPGTANAEIVIITGISTLTLTVTRGQEGTTAVAHNDGSVFIAEVTAGALGNMLQTLAGSDGNYYIRRSGLWAPGTPSYNDLSDVPATFTPADGSVTDAKVNSSAAIAESKLSLASDAAAATASRRTLGTGSTQAAAGNHTHVYSTLTSIPTTFAPSAHASSHLKTGSDSAAALLQYTPYSPAKGAWITQAPIDVNAIADAVGPTAGTVLLTKVLCPDAFTINTLDLHLNQAGTGATALANCFVGIYDSGGTRRFASSDQSSVWNSGSNSAKTITVTGGYVVTANDYIYIAILVGTQSTTNVKFGCYTPFQSSLLTFNLAAAAYIGATNGSGLTSLPSPTITLSSNATTGRVFWVGIR